MAEKFEIKEIVTDLTEQEKLDLNTQINKMIADHSDNRQEINRLVFECTEAMTEGDDAQAELSNKGFLARITGGLTGSNATLQNKINSSYAVAQYASEQILQRLAEQNLMSFELVTAVNNKLNASIQATNMEFNNIYNGLNKFFRSAQSNLVRMSGAIEQLNERVTRLENKTVKLDRRTMLLNWEVSIEYLEFDGENYRDLDNASKIVCLARDFYDITKGEWETSDLLLLKKAMSVIGIDPRDKVNFLSVVKEISEQESLRKKYLGDQELKEKVDPSYLVSTGTIQKFQALKGDESYIVDSMLDSLGEAANANKIRESLAQNYMKKNAGVNLNTEIESYDLVLDFLYNMEEFSGLLTPVTGELEVAIDTFLTGNRVEAFRIFNKLADAGNGRACYWICLYYLNGYGVVQLDSDKADEYRKKGCELGDRIAIFSNNMLIESNVHELTSYAELLLNSTEINEVDAQIQLGNFYRSSHDYREAIKWYKKSAEQGFANAQNKLGYMYENGQGVEQSYEEAVKWYRKAAEQELASGQNSLGVMYNNGQGVEQSYEEAVKWYRKAAEQGLASGQNRLGVMYDYGQGVEQSYEEAVKWYRKAAEQGDASGQCNLGLMYENGQGIEQSYEEAVKWYRKAAEQGNADGQYNLGDMYENGQGVEQSYEEALKWYRKAAEQGNASGQNRLGLMYENGQGVEQSYEEAVKWYRKAAEQGNADGQYNLGDMYENGKGVEQSYEEAVKWYQKAAEQGDMDGQNSLGLMYENGKGVEQSYEEAVKWYRKAAEQGFANAQSNLGYMYKNGQGVEQSYEEALKWYRKAAEQGNASGQNRLGLMYENGQGVEQSYEEAVKWYRKAAEQGNADGQYNLGDMYENGKGVEQSHEEAEKWYQKAADQGHARSAMRLFSLSLEEDLQKLRQCKF